MGWLYMQGLGGFDTPRAYLDNQFTYVRETHRLAVLASALVGLRTYYAAIERTETTGDCIVFGVVCLVNYNPRAVDGYTFGYKDMDETAGPHQSDCPAQILDLLTPTDHDYALQWRGRCRARLGERQLLAARPTPRPGQTVIFDPPLCLSNGRTVSRFEVVKHPQSGPPLYRDAETRELVRIAKVKARSYRLINPVVRPDV
jgi:hypothetical protein